MTGREKFQKYKSVLNLMVKFIKIIPIRFRKALLNHFRNINDKKGLAIRYILLKSLNDNVGDNISIHPGCYLFSVDNLEIGDNVSIHPMCYIDATGGIKIGSDVSIAHGTTILSTSHSFGDKEISIKYQEILKRKTEIGNNVWIGCKSTILYGVNIESGSIVGACSLVNKNVSGNTIVFNKKIMESNNR